MSNSIIENTNWGNFSKSFQGIVEKVSQPKVWACAATAAGFVAATTTAVAFAAPAAAMACFTAAIVSAVSALIFATIAGVIWAVQHRKNAGGDGQSRIHEKQPNDSGGAAFSEQPMATENGTHITFDQHQSENVGGGPMPHINDATPIISEEVAPRGGGAPFRPDPQPQPHTPTEDGGMPWEGPMSEEEQKFYEGLAGNNDAETLYLSLTHAGREIYKTLTNEANGAEHSCLFLYDNKDRKHLKDNEMRRIVEALPEKFVEIATDDLLAIGFDASHPIEWAKYTQLKYVTITDPTLLKNLDQAPILESLDIDPAGNDVGAIKDTLLRMKGGYRIYFRSSLKRFGFTVDDLKTILDHGNEFFVAEQELRRDFLTQVFGPAKQGSEETDDVRIRPAKDGKKYKCYFDPDSRHLKIEEAKK